MSEPVPIAAIDAGSNGIRLLIGEVDDNGRLEHLENFREPVRLGTDAFHQGYFNTETIDAAVRAFERFAKTVKEHKVVKLRAVATSAVREAKNRRELIQRVRQESGIKLELIDGLEEAHLVMVGVADAVDLSNQTAILVDMGGGSVEVTVTQDGSAMASESLRLGPVRLLQKLEEKGLKEADTDKLIERFRGTIRNLIDAEIEDDRAPRICIGTGGNIERMSKLRVQLLDKVKTGKVKAGDLDPIIEKLLALSPSQRVKQLDLRPDRADVIAIAMIVFRMIVKEVGAQRVIVPGVGLKEGLLREVARSVYEDE